MIPLIWAGLTHALAVGSLGAGESMMASLTFLAIDSLSPGETGVTESCDLSWPSRLVWAGSHAGGCILGE